IAELAGAAGSRTARTTSLRLTAVKLPGVTGLARLEATRLSTKRATAPGLTRSVPARLVPKPGNRASSAPARRAARPDTLSGPGAGGGARHAPACRPRPGFRVWGQP